MEIFIDALKDTAGLVPFLALIYFAIGFLEYRYGDRMSHFIMRVGVMGPVAGALVGCIPQCGFSVVASTLYVKRLISTGTLLAVFISTSDEAVPILLSVPGRLGMVTSLIFIKLIIAVIAGMTVDRLSGVFDSAKSGKDRVTGASCGDTVLSHTGCCSHGLDNKSSRMKALVIHPLTHTVKIMLFILILTSAFNLFVKFVGEDKIASILLGGTILQPALASFIGMIPNCFASVLLAGLFAKGIISFGSLIAGLSAGAGLGLLVLAKENKDRIDTLRIIGLLLAISIAAGSLIQFLGGSVWRQ
ncbi:MAG: arsenic efflux protein [Candidatus Omnitrophica bacterium]|nr:arsenic efflux protein [Candidatus Omnitrophota bacterium]